MVLCIALHCFAQSQARPHRVSHGVPRGPAAPSAPRAPGGRGPCNGGLAEQHISSLKHEDIKE